VIRRAPVRGVTWTWCLHPAQAVALNDVPLFAERRLQRTKAGLRRRSVRTARARLSDIGFRRILDGALMPAYRAACARAYEAENPIFAYHWTPDDGSGKWMGLDRTSR